ncbi:hypothetical protein HWV62_37211 [Athelia sp. TMB]|nr:hypothetical protein HWV62_37211 [Athelia sp. TMB]
MGRYSVLGAMFVTLPSPAVPESALEQNLRDGMHIIRAYKAEYFLPQTILGRTRIRNTFAIRWLFDRANNTLFANDIPFSGFHPESEREGTTFHTQYQVPVITTGMTETALPWSNIADTTLMETGIIPDYHQGSGLASISLQLTRQREAEDGTVTYSIFPAPLTTTRDIPALLTLEYPIPASGTSVPRFCFPNGPFSASPSRTLPIRRAILLVLAYVAFIVKFVALAGVGALTFGFWVSLAFLLWAIAFGSLKSWRKGFISKVPVEVNAGEQMSRPVTEDERAEFADKMV